MLLYYRKGLKLVDVQYAWAIGFYGGAFSPQLKGTKSKSTKGKQWVVGVVEWRGGGCLTSLHGIEQDRAVRAGKHYSLTDKGICTHQLQECVNNYPQLGDFTTCRVFGHMIQ